MIKTPSSPLVSLVPSIYLPSLLVAIGQQAILLLLPLYALALGGSVGVAAVLLGMKGLGTMLSDVPLGMAVSRWGDKRTMLGSLLVCLLSSIGFAVVSSTWLLMVFALVFGVGVGGWMLSRLHYVAERCPMTYRGRAMTVMAGIHRVGNFVGPALGGITATTLGFTSVFLGTAVLIVSGYILITLFTKDTPPRQTHGQDEDLHRPLRAFIHIVQTHRKIFLNVGSATVLLQFIRAGRILLIPLWGEYIGLSTAQIGLAISLSSIVDAGLFYVAGYLMDHWGRKWSSVPTMILLALSLGLLPFSYSHTLFVITVLISGVGNGFGTGIVMTLGADYSPAKNRGEFLGAWRFLGDSGSAIGPFVIGLAAETFLLSGALWFTAGVGVLGAVVFAWGTQETLRRRPY